MNTLSKKSFSILILLAGGLLVGFSTGQWLAPMVAWIGPVLIIRYSRDHKVGRGFLMIIAAYILAFLIGFGGMWFTLGGAGMAIGLAVLYSVLWALPFLADRLLGSRLPGFTSTLVYPFAAGTLEFINTYTNPLGNWGSTGYTQYGNLGLMQLSSVTGMIGITFLMGWFASSLNWGWENRDSRIDSMRGISIFTAVFALVFVFGFARLNVSPLSSTEETIRIAGITNATQPEFFDSLGGFKNWREDPSSAAAQQAVQARWGAYLADTVREAKAGAQLVIWNEIAAPTSSSDLASMTAIAQDVAKQNGIYLVVPTAVFYSYDTGKLFENTLLLIDPSGTVVLEHDKYGGAIIESLRMTGDKKLHAANTPFGKISGVICWDMDYPTILRQAGKNGTGLMLAPSSDFPQIDPIHTYMAVFRAVENGMSVVRQTEFGLSVAVDAYGRVLAQTDFYGASDRTMVAQVPVEHVTTIYTLFGHYFEWVCVAGFLFLFARALVTRRQSS